MARPKKKPPAWRCNICSRFLPPGLDDVCIGCFEKSFREGEAVNAYSCCKRDDACLHEEALDRLVEEALLRKHSVDANGDAAGLSASRNRGLTRECRLSQGVNIGQGDLLDLSNGEEDLPELVPLMLCSLGDVKRLPPVGAKAHYDTEADGSSMPDLSDGEHNLPDLSDGEDHLPDGEDDLPGLVPWTRWSASDVVVDPH